MMILKGVQLLLDKDGRRGGLFCRFVGPKIYYNHSFGLVMVQKV
jgi:hypothetical protein